MSGAGRWAEGCSWLGLPAIGARGQFRFVRADLVRQVAAAVERRRAAGFSIRKIAERLGVAPITVHRWRRAAVAQGAGSND